MVLVEEYCVLILQWSLFLLSTIFLASRLYVRIYCFGSLKQRGTYRWSELFVALSWVFWCVELCLYTPIQLLNGYYDTVGGYVPPSNHEYWEHNYKIQFASGCLCRLIAYAAKFALLCFYQELCPKQESFKIWVAIMTSWVVNVGGALVFLGYRFFMCIPLQRVWTLTPDGNLDSCVNSGHYIQVQDFFNVLTDLMVYTIPFFILAKLNRSSKDRSRQRLAVPAVMFSLGFINLGIAVTKFAFAISRKGNQWSTSAMDYLQAVWFFTAVVIPCVPYVRRTYVDFISWLARGKTKVARKHLSHVRSTVVSAPTDATGWWTAWTRRDSGPDAVQAEKRPDAEEVSVVTIEAVIPEVVTLETV